MVKLISDEQSKVCPFEQVVLLSVFSRMRLEKGFPFRMVWWTSSLMLQALPGLDWVCSSALIPHQFDFPLQRVCCHPMYSGCQTTPCGIRGRTRRVTTDRIQGGQHKIYLFFSTLSFACGTYLLFCLEMGSAVPLPRRLSDRLSFSPK